MRARTSRKHTGAWDEGLTGASRTATSGPAAPKTARARIGQVWATCPCHAQDGCRTCAGSGVVISPRLDTDDSTSPSDLTINLTERTTW